MTRYAYLRTGFICCFTLLGSFLAKAQSEVPIPLDSIQQMKVKKHTLMARFEPGYTLTAKERLQLKEARRQELLLRLKIIDTMDLRFNKRWRLLEELYLSPHSEKWNKIIADLELEEPDQ